MKDLTTNIALAEAIAELQGNKKYAGKNRSLWSNKEEQLLYFLKELQLRRIASKTLFLKMKEAEREIMELADEMNDSSELLIKE